MLQKRLGRTRVKSSFVKTKTKTYWSWQFRVFWSTHFIRMMALDHFFCSYDHWKQAWPEEDHIHDLWAPSSLFMMLGARRLIEMVSLIWRPSETHSFGMNLASFQLITCLFPKSQLLPILRAFHCFHRVLCWINSRQRDFMQKKNALIS